MKYLKWLIFLIVFIVIVVLVINNFPKKEEKIVPSSPKIVSLTFDDEKVGYINVHDIHINESDGNYIFMANLTNLTADPINYQTINVYVKDKNDNLIMTLTGYFGGSILGEETKNVIIKTNKNLSKAKNLEFTFK